MPLQIRPMRREDFEYLSEQPTRSFDNFARAIWGDPVPPEVQKWDSLQLGQSLEHAKPNEFFVKVVDDAEAKEEFVSWAKWIVYRDGFPAKGDAEFTGDCPKGFNKPLFEDFQNALTANRQSAGIVGRPCWFLEFLFTMEKHFRRGAGRMLVQWGLNKAKEDNLPAYLDASPMGYPLYLKCGFVDLKSVCRIDLHNGRGEEDCCRAMIKEP